MIRVLALLLLFSGSASAFPPPGTDLTSPRHIWFECHVQPSGGSCCSEADGHSLTDTEWRMAGDHYQVQIEGKWWDVPNTTVLVGDTCGPDPLEDGRSEAKVWYSLTRDLASELADVHFYCFLPGTQW